MWLEQRMRRQKFLVEEIIWYPVVQNSLESLSSNYNKLPDFKEERIEF